MTEVEKVPVSIRIDAEEEEVEEMTCTLRW